MTMRIYTTVDAFNQLLPRHACRRERTPGRRERHATQRERLSPEPNRKMITHNSKPETSTSSSYCHTSGSLYNQQAHKQVPTEPEIRVSSYKELSTIEEIRSDMKTTASRKPAPKVAHVPDWLLNLDINLDVTSVDIIPPFENEAKGKTDSFKEKVDMTLMYSDEDEEDEDEDNIELDASDTNDTIETMRPKTGPVCKSCASTKGSEKLTTERSGRASPQKSARSGSSTPTGSYMLDSIGPRRFQGDKKVMSLQQGGIRSTPMQPKAKKFINQMITYRHMKIHDNKLQKAKAAVDTKMPSTFHMALERKRLVETRLSRSFDSTRDLSQSRSSQTDLNRTRSQNSSR